MNASARVLAAQGGWYEAELDTAKNRIVYTVVRAFDELSPAEIIKYAKEVEIAKSKELASW